MQNLAKPLPQQPLHTPEGTLPTLWRDSSSSSSAHSPYPVHAHPVESFSLVAALSPARNCVTKWQRSTKTVGEQAVQHRPPTVGGSHGLEKQQQQKKQKQEQRQKQLYREKRTQYVRCWAPQHRQKQQITDAAAVAAGYTGAMDSPTEHGGLLSPSRDPRWSRLLRAPPITFDTKNGDVNQGSQSFKGAKQVEVTQDSSSAAAERTKVASFHNARRGVAAVSVGSANPAGEGRSESARPPPIICFSPNSRPPLTSSLPCVAFNSPASAVFSESSSQYSSVSEFNSSSSSDWAQSREVSPTTAARNADTKLNRTQHQDTAKAAARFLGAPTTKIISLGSGAGNVNTVPDVIADAPRPRATAIGPVARPRAGAGTARGFERPLPRPAVESSAHDADSAAAAAAKALTGGVEEGVHQRQQLQQADSLLKAGVARLAGDRLNAFGKHNAPRSSSQEDQQADRSNTAVAAKPSPPKYWTPWRSQKGIDKREPVVSDEESDGSKNAWQFMAGRETLASPPPASRAPMYPNFESSSPLAATNGPLADVTAPWGAPIEYQPTAAVISATETDFSEDTDDVDDALTAILEGEEEDDEEEEKKRGTWVEDVEAMSSDDSEDEEVWLWSPNDVECDLDYESEDTESKSDSFDSGDDCKRSSGSPPEEVVEIDRGRDGVEGSNSDNSSDEGEDRTSLVGVDEGTFSDLRWDDFSAVNTNSYASSLGAGHGRGDVPIDTSGPAAAVPTPLHSAPEEEEEGDNKSCVGKEEQGGDGIMAGRNDAGEEVHNSEPGDQTENPRLCAETLAAAATAPTACGTASNLRERHASCDSDVCADLGHVKSSCYVNGCGDSDAESEYTPAEALEVLRKAAVRFSMSGNNRRESMISAAGSCCSVGSSAASIGVTDVTDTGSSRGRASEGFEGTPEDHQEGKKEEEAEKREELVSLAMVENGDKSTPTDDPYCADETQNKDNAREGLEPVSIATSYFAADDGAGEAVDAKNPFVGKVKSPLEGGAKGLVLENTESVLRMEKSFKKACRVLGIKMSHFFDTILESSLGDVDDLSATDAAAAVATAAAGITTPSSNVIVAPLNPKVAAAEAAAAKKKGPATPPTTPATVIGTPDTPPTSDRPIILGRGWRRIKSKPASNNSNDNNNNNNNTGGGGHKILKRSGSSIRRRMRSAAGAAVGGGSRKGNDNGVVVEGADQSAAPPSPADNATNSGTIGSNGDENCPTTPTPSPTTDDENENDANEGKGYDDHDDDGFIEVDVSHAVAVDTSEGDSGDIDLTSNPPRVVNCPGKRMLVSSGVFMENTHVVGADLLLVRGVFKGAVDVKALDVEEGATVRGDVSADTVTVQGTLDGNMECKKLLVVRRGGRCAGTVSYSDMRIEPGADLEADLTLLPPASNNNEGKHPPLPPPSPADSLNQNACQDSPPMVSWPEEKVEGQVGNVDVGTDSTTTAEASLVAAPTMTDASVRAPIATVVSAAVPASIGADDVTTAKVTFADVSSSGVVEDDGEKATAVSGSQERTTCDGRGEHDATEDTSVSLSSSNVLAKAAAIEEAVVARGRQQRRTWTRKFPQTLLPSSSNAGGATTTATTPNSLLRKHNAMHPRPVAPAASEGIAATLGEKGGTDHLPSQHGPTGLSAAVEAMAEKKRDVEAEKRKKDEEDAARRKDQERTFSAEKGGGAESWTIRTKEISLAVPTAFGRPVTCLSPTSSPTVSKRFGRRTKPGGVTMSPARSRRFTTTETAAMVDEGKKALLAARQEKRERENRPDAMSACQTAAVVQDGDISLEMGCVQGAEGEAPPSSHIHSRAPAVMSLACGERGRSSSSCVDSSRFSSQTPAATRAATASPVRGTSLSKHQGKRREHNNHTGHQQRQQQQREPSTKLERCTAFLISLVAHSSGSSSSPAKTGAKGDGERAVHVSLVGDTLSAPTPECTPPRFSNHMGGGGGHSHCSRRAGFMTRLPGTGGGGETVGSVKKNSSAHSSVPVECAEEGGGREDMVKIANTTSTRKHLRKGRDDIGASPAGVPLVRQRRFRRSVSLEERRCGGGPSAAIAAGEEDFDNQGDESSSDKKGLVSSGFGAVGDALAARRKIRGWRKVSSGVEPGSLW